MTVLASDDLLDSALGASNPAAFGMRFSVGRLSPSFSSDADRLHAVLNDAFVLIHETYFETLRELLPLLQLVTQTRKPLLVVVQDEAGEPVATLVVNCSRGTLDVCAVKTPGFAVSAVAARGGAANDSQVFVEPDQSPLSAHEVEAMSIVRVSLGKSASVASLMLAIAALIAARPFRIEDQTNE